MWSVAVITVSFQHFSALVPGLFHDATKRADEAGNAWWTEYKLSSHVKQ